MLQFRIVIAVSLIVAACTAGSTSSPGISTAVPVGASPSVASPRPTPTPVPVGTCPTDSPMTVAQFIEADPSCSSGTDVEIRGWLGAGTPIGFEWGIAPGWLYFPRAELSTIWEAGPVGPDGDCLMPGGRVCESFIWHIDPASGLELTGPPRWLIVKGHLDDPVAQTCRYVYPEDWTDVRADDAQAVTFCRGQFVIVAFRDAP